MPNVNVYVRFGKKGNRPEDICLHKSPNYKRFTLHVPNKKGMGRAKGAGLENQTAKIFSRWIYGNPKYLKRTPLSGGWAGVKAGDIILVHEYAERGMYNPPIYVECRFYKDLMQGDFLNWVEEGTPKVYTDFIEEVESKAKKKLPFLVIKGNNTKAWVMVLRRWFCPGDALTAMMAFANIRFWRSSFGYGYLIPLERLPELGDGKKFLKKWREDGGSNHVPATR
jgi:hypothetical protein